MVIFILILLIGVVTTDSRSCGDREALIGASCQPCVDAHCSDCTGDHTRCVGNGVESKCAEGFWLRDDGMCVDCDIATSNDVNPSDILDKSKIVCLKCASKKEDDTKAFC
jgi:hypothetical protein